MGKFEFTREDAELAIRQRIGRSKLLTKLLAAVALPVGLASGLIGNSDVVPEASLALAIAGGSAVFVDTTLRERRCNQIVGQYSDALDVPKGSSRVSVKELAAGEDGDIELDIAVNDLTVTLTNSRAARINATGSIGVMATIVGVDKFVEARDTMAVLGWSPEMVPGTGLAVLGIGSFIARNSALDEEAGRFSQQLDNVEWAAMDIAP